LGAWREIEEMNKKNTSLHKVEAIMAGERLVEDVFKTAEYVFKKWLESPTVKRWFALDAAREAAAAAAAEARLAAGMAKLRTASLAMGAADLAVTAGLPLATWVGVFVAMGAPYDEARTLVRHQKFLSGFSQGFVTGILNWQWPQAVSRFFNFGPGNLNPFDASLSYIGANSYNDGLRAGYIHARSLGEDVRQAFLRKLRSRSPLARAGRWDRQDQIGYVIDLASAGIAAHIFRPD
jgi:hypothetical protein